jgi:putative addiction module killer protein
MDIIVKDYIRADQSNPFQQWMKNLDRHAKSKVEQAIFRLGMGNTSAINWFGGIGEYRIDWGPGYRIYLVQDGAKLIILFGGGTKQRQQADITHAKMLYQEYKQRKKSVG